MNKKISNCAMCAEYAQWEAHGRDCTYTYSVFCTNLDCGNGTSPLRDVKEAIDFWNEMQPILEKGLRFDEYKAIVDASSEHSRGGRL